MAFETPINFGAGVSLRIANEPGSFVASPGFADPRLVVRRRERPTLPLLQFDRCVFRFQFPPKETKRRNSMPKRSSDQNFMYPSSSTVSATGGGHLTYGRTVCLMHAYSGLYVTVVRKPAGGSHAHCSIVLMSLEDAGSACRFRVMPRYKIRSEGDRVMDKDMVYLQQESSQLSLHGVPATTAGPEDAECTASEVPTSLEINLYDENEHIGGQHQNDDSPGGDRHPILRAGCACVVFHREKDAILTVLESALLSVQSGGGHLLRTSGSSSPTSKSPFSATLSPTLNAQRAQELTSSLATLGASSSDASVCFHHYDKPVTNLSPEQLEYGCNALWFYENVDPTIGGTIEPHTPFRLRHGATGRYLGRTGRQRSPNRFVPLAKMAELAADGSDTSLGSFALMDLSTLESLDATIFELEVVSSGDIISVSRIYSAKSFVRLRHRHSGLYLSSTLLKGPTGVAAALSSTGGGLGAVSSLRAADQPNLEDTVTVLMVSRRKQQELCYLIGNVEFLSSYIKLFYAMQDPKCQLRPHDIVVTRVVQRAIASLSALICFCTESDDDDPLTREGLPIPTHQQSMFEVQLHRIVMDVLLCPFVSAQKENKMELPLEGGVLNIKSLLDEKHEHIHRVCRLCYRLLKQMSKGSPYAGQLVDYVSFMQAQEGYKLHVADTQLEIFTNNPNIPADRCVANVKHFVNLLLTKERSSGYLRFLSSLCVVNGNGVPSNQALVATLLLETHRDAILYQTKMENSTLMILVPPSSGTKKKGKGKSEGPPATDEPKPKAKDAPEDAGPKWMPLVMFLRTGEAKMIKFFESSIELLGNLCIGADERCLSLVRSFLTIEHITAAIEPSFACSNGLRTSYFTVALHAYLRVFLRAKRPPGSAHVGNVCGALVGPNATESNSTLSNTSFFTADSAGIDASDLHQNAFIHSVKRTALSFIRSLRDDRTAATSGSDLVLILSHVWHSVVVFEAYTHDELEEAVHAVITCLDPGSEATSGGSTSAGGGVGSVMPNVHYERYRRSEDTEHTMKMFLGLCTFLSTVLDHELLRIVDIVLTELSRPVNTHSGNDSPSGTNEIDDPASQNGRRVLEIAVALLKQLETTFVEESLQVSLMDLMFYENKALVAAAVELSLTLRNAASVVATRVQDAELVRSEASNMFNHLLRAHVELRRNLTVGGHFTSEAAVVAVVRSLTAFDPRGDAVDPETPNRRTSMTGVVEDDEVPAGLVSAHHSGTPRAAIGGDASSKWKGAVGMIAASNRMHAGATSRRTQWRRRVTGLEEYSRLLFRSQLHQTLIKLLQPDGSGSALPSESILTAVLQFFRVLCIVNENASALDTHLGAFVALLDMESTKVDAAIIILRIVEANPWLADKLDSRIVTELTNLMLQSKILEIAEGLQHVVLGEYPVARNQTLVLNALVESKAVASFIAEAMEDHTAQRMSIRSASVDLAACCCVNNMSCRSMVAQLISADDIMLVLERSTLPPQHLVPFYKLLTSAYLSAEDDDLTAQELHFRRRQWADNALWWRLVDGRIFQVMQAAVDDDEDGGPNVIDEELLFSGVVPMLQSYFAHLYGAAPCAKSKVAIPIGRIARKVAMLADGLLKPRGRRGLNLKSRHVVSLCQLLTSFISHGVTEVPLSVPSVSLNQSSSASDHGAVMNLSSLAVKLMSLSTCDSNEMSPSNDVTGSKPVVCRLPGSEVFSSWVPNSEDALHPLLKLWTGGNEACAFKCQQPGLLRFKRLHELLVQHVADGSLKDRGAIGVMSVLRHMICLLEEGSDAFIESQKYINSIGVLKMITERAFTSSESSGGVALQLGVAVLEGGNRHVQDHLLNFFMSTDERFFHESAHLISTCTRRAMQMRARDAYLCFYSTSRTRPLSFGNLEYNLRFLQLMCEGHHSGLQDYLREQHDNLRSVNVVKDIVRLVGELVQHEVSDHHFSLMVQALNALTEFCQGPCVGNQQLVASLGGCQSICAVLTWPTFHVETPVEGTRSEQLLELKGSAVKLLLALLEGNTDDSIAAFVLNDIPMFGISALTKQLIESQEFHHAESDHVCEIVYSLMIAAHNLVNTVSNSDDGKRTEQMPLIEEARRMLETYSGRCGMLGKIEIERHDRIERVYFRVPTICSLLTEATRQKLLWSLDRSTQGSKLSDFIDKVDEVIFDLEATERVTQKMMHNKIFTQFMKVPLHLWDDLGLLIAIVMNLLFVGVVEDAQGLMDKHIDWFGVEGIIRLCAYAQVVVSVIIAVVDSSLNFPLILYKRSKALGSETIPPQQDVSLTMWQKASAIASRSETVYRMSNVAFALMGFFFSDFFFAFHLLGLIGKSSVLMNVIVAVTLNGKSLLLTGMLGCILVYLFSIIGFVMFQDHFEDGCGTLSNCVLHILTSGLRQGGGIGDRMKEIKYGEDMYLRRTIYDFLFWAIMIVIFLNILFGIIIDTFAELRDEKNKKEEDMRSKCLICGIDAFTFDRYGTGFREHVQKEHNMWQYLYFLHHLRRKESTEYTGQESYVAACVANSDISFFPSGKCLSLKGITVSGDATAGSDESHQGTEGSAAGAGSAQSRGARPTGATGTAGAPDFGPFSLEPSRASGVDLGSIGHDAALSMQASISMHQEQTMGLLQRLLQRMDAMEKSSHGTGSDGRSATPPTRFSRLDSGTSRGPDGANREGHMMRAQQHFQQQQLIEADQSYQISLAHARQDFEMRSHDLYDNMETAFHTFADFFRLATALSDVYQRTKADLFVSAVGCQMLVLTAKAKGSARVQQAIEHAEKFQPRAADDEATPPGFDKAVWHMLRFPSASSGVDVPTPKSHFDDVFQRGREYMSKLRSARTDSPTAHPDE